jgi:Amiloride-sensitive sodium channel
MKFATMLMTEMSEFCATANIHGLQHVANQRNHPILRIVWFLIVAIAFVLSGICIKSSFEGMQK